MTAATDGLSGCCVKPGGLLPPEVGEHFDKIHLIAVHRFILS